MVPLKQPGASQQALSPCVTPAVRRFLCAGTCRGLRGKGRALQALSVREVFLCCDGDRRKPKAQLGTGVKVEMGQGVWFKELLQGFFLPHKFL